MEQPGIEKLVNRYRLEQPVFVTQPNLPRLDDYKAMLDQIWVSKWLTNDGDFHRQFEQRLSAHLDAEQLNLFCNGTLALLVALQSLGIDSGEVITTPFTFPATSHVLHWNRIRPVFCDIEPTTFNLDPTRIEALIGPETKAILPVHVFGHPCDVDAIQSIADRHGLHVIYDAAHAFGVRYRGRSLVKFGDVSMLSFHATKLFTSIEGGALITKSAAQKDRIDSLKNFGIADEETVIGPGINGKMNEFQAAFGLLTLDIVDDEIKKRESLSRIYFDKLRDVPGLRFIEEIPDTHRNYAYLPVLVDEELYGMSRNELHETLKGFNVNTRKYFHLLCSHFECYSALPSAGPGKLPVAERIASQILCLPLYGGLQLPVVESICGAIQGLHEMATSGSPDQ